jgi:hypothetical protein
VTKRVTGLDAFRKSTLTPEPRVHLLTTMSSSEDDRSSFNDSGSESEGYAPVKKVGFVFAVFHVVDEDVC